MTTVSVKLSKFQYFIIDDLRSKGTFGSDDAEIVKGAFLAYCSENGITPKPAAKVEGGSL